MQNPWDQINNQSPAAEEEGKSPKKRTRLNPDDAKEGIDPAVNE